MNAMTSYQFLSIYKDSQRKFFYRSYKNTVSEIGMEALIRTLKVVRLFITDADIPSYVEYVFRWARNKRIRVDHQALRSHKLISSFLSKRYRGYLSGSQIDAVRHVQAIRKLPDYKDEVQALLLAAKGVYTTTHDVEWSLLVALEQRNWRYEKQLTGFVRSYCAGDPRVINTVKNSRGLDVFTETH